jgi:hypothetical protein
VPGGPAPPGILPAPGGGATTGMVLGAGELDAGEDAGVLVPEVGPAEMACLLARSAWRRCWFVSWALVEEIKARKAAAAAYFIAGGK